MTEQTQREINKAFRILKEKGYPDGCSIDNQESWCWNCQKYTKTITSDPEIDEMQEDCLVCYCDKNSEAGLNQ